MENPTAAKFTPETIPVAKSNLEPELGNDSWQMLQIFSIYRCLLTTAFFILYAVKAGTVGKEEPLIYLYGLLIYLLLSVVYVFDAFVKNQKYHAQVNLQILTDIAALTMILHTSGGLVSGLNILFLPVVAAASVLNPGKKSFFYAAIATIAILLEQLFSYLQLHPKYTDGFTLAGLNGIALFATTIAVNYIYNKLKISQTLGREYAAKIEKFEQIITLVLHKIPIGVIVIDNTNQIYMTNEVAKKLIGKNIPDNLQHLIKQWRNINTSNHCDLNHNGIHLAAQFIQVGPDKQNHVVIMLENLSQQEQQAQNLKLISLGRLTASIAHEIRNPLNAISHSAQLLGESKTLDSEDARLLTIIQHNSERTNKIIESVLLLSKSKPIAQQQIQLNSWLNKFIAQFISHGHKDSSIELECDHQNCNVNFDPTHLQQILTNLCENGIRYSMQITKQPTVKLHLGMEEDQVYLDVIDNGPGVIEKNLNFLFEPFFTTEPTGTGLGLFVARELAQANGAKLIYHPDATMRGCFRLYFLNNS